MNIYYKIGENLEQLDLTDRKILLELDKNSRIPLTKLAKKVRKSRQAVEYRMEQMIRKKIILGFNTSIDPYKLGFKVYKIFLQLKNKPEQKEKLIHYLNYCGKVYWYGECDGEWNLIFGIYAKSDFEFYEIKNKILSRFGGIILKHRGTILLDSLQYPKTYFLQQVSEPVIFGGEIKETTLSKTDKDILSELVNNARIPITKLANKVKSTISIVRSRIRRMEESGLIIQYRISINLEKLDLEFFKATIHLENQSMKEERKLIELVSRIPNTQYFIRNLWEVELELVVKNYGEYNEIMNRIRMEFSDTIKNIETVIIKSDVWIPRFIM